MSLTRIVDLIHSAESERWNDRNTEAFASLFGTPGGRYRAGAKDDFALRAPEMGTDSEAVRFAAYIHPSNPKSGRYHGLSFVMFPVSDGPCLFGLVVGTDGLSPDEAILGRPGHACKAQAICAWLNASSKGRRVAWAKQDPTRTDVEIPKDVQQEWPAYKKVFDRYGKEIYAFYCPTDNRDSTELAVAAFLDLMMQERGDEPMAGAKDHAAGLRGAWFDFLMPSVEAPQVKRLLETRRYVIIQGPPGTGKTKMAVDLLKGEYGGFGRSIQFHPNTTYENFIGGLAPVHGSGELGLHFAPARGFLMEAVARALEDPTRPYLLHIDEINRADLGKILGESIFLLEAGDEGSRRVELPYDFGPPFSRQFFLPPHLHIVGTMNSADRSIALVDVAVRRRFGFVSLWPRMSVVERMGCELTREAFRKLVSHFVEHASDDAFALVPGHSYFLESDTERARESLQVNLAPLLEEYLAQGYVSGFAEPIRSYLQWLRAL